MAGAVVFSNPKGKGGGSSKGKGKGKGGGGGSRRGFSMLPDMRTVGMTTAGVVASSMLPSYIAAKWFPPAAGERSFLSTPEGQVIGSAAVGVIGGGVLGYAMRKTDGAAFAVGGLAVAASKAFNAWILPKLLPAPPAPGPNDPGTGEDTYYALGEDGEYVEIGEDTYYALANG